MSDRLFDAIRAAAPSDAPFIRIDSTRTWTYNDALALSGRIASAMDALGIRPGDRVAVQVENAEAVHSLSRLSSKRRGLPAAQHRLYPG